MRYAKSRRKSNRPEEHDQSDLHDALKAFDTFRQELLPMLQEDILKGTPPEALRKKYLSYLTARQIQIGLTDPQSANALAAIKDLQDRTEGKPAQTNINVNKYEQLSDEQLDAAVLSANDDLKDLLQ